MLGKSALFHKLAYRKYNQHNADRKLTITTEGGQRHVLGSGNPRTEGNFDESTCTACDGKALTTARVEKAYTITMTDGKETAYQIIAKVGEKTVWNSSKVKYSWKKTENSMHITVCVPANTTAELVLTKVERRNLSAGICE